MQAQLKEWISPDIIDAETYKPLYEDEFNILIEATIGLDDGSEGGDYFQIVVCTPKWLLNNHMKADVIWGRHMMIVFEYDLERIIKKIKDYVAQCTGSDWMEIAGKLARIAQWEFEDYDANPRLI